MEQGMTLPVAASRPALANRFGRWVRRQRIEPYLYLVPAALTIGIWIYRTLVQTFDLSFFQWNLLPTSPRIPVGWENYEQLLKLPEMGRALSNTLIYMIGILPLSVLIPMFIALFTNDLSPRARNIYRAFIFMPMIMAPVVVAVIWRWLLHPTQGLINIALQNWFGTAPIRFFSDGNIAIYAIIFVTGWKLIGFSSLIFSAAVSNINRDYIEAASVDGATRWQVVRFITLPLLSPTVLFMVMLSVLFSSQWSFAYINVLTQGGPLDSTTNIYYLLYTFAFGTFNIGWGAAAAILVLIGFGLIAVIFNRLSTRFAFYDS